MGYFIQISLHCRQALLDMNRAPPSKRMRETKEFNEDVEAYDNWKLEREHRLA